MHAAVELRAVSAPPADHKRVPRRSRMELGIWQSEVAGDGREFFEKCAVRSARILPRKRRMR
jgi:hypothetical protein